MLPVCMCCNKGPSVDHLRQQVEYLTSENRSLQEDNQRLRLEVAGLRQCIVPALGNARKSRSTQPGAKCARQRTQREDCVGISCLNFLGNACNALEFFSDTRNFRQNYDVVREAFFTLTSEEVTAEMESLGFSRNALDLSQSKIFMEHCTQEFLSRDNKVDLSKRTNLIVGGMSLFGRNARPLFHFWLDWRPLIKRQEVYRAEPQLLAWDVACNLAAERSGDMYLGLQAGSCLNPDRTIGNMQTMVDRICIHKVTLCAVQEFPEPGSAMMNALLDEFAAKQLYHVRPEGENSSVGFILSNCLEIEKQTYMPLGCDVACILRALERHASAVRAPALDVAVDEATRASLQTTARKSFMLDIAPCDWRPGLRALCIHAKRFRTELGVRVLARYICACLGEVKDRDAVALLDSNIEEESLCHVFCNELKSQKVDVLTPAGEYLTTRKTRSEMHGQIYDKRKCLQTVQGHKDFILLSRSEGRGFRCEGPATAFPNLKADPQDLPNAGWPSDHCMLQVELLPAQGPDATEQARTGLPAQGNVMPTDGPTPASECTF